MILIQGCLRNPLIVFRVGRCKRGRHGYCRVQPRCFAKTTEVWSRLSGALYDLECVDRWEDARKSGMKGKPEVKSDGECWRRVLAGLCTEAHCGYKQQLGEKLPNLRCFIRDKIRCLYIWALEQRMHVTQEGEDTSSVRGRSPGVPVTRRNQPCGASREEHRQNTHSSARVNP